MIRLFSDKIKEMGTNVKYNLNQWSTQNNILKENDELVLLGSIYSTQDPSLVEKYNILIAELFCNIIWISYRKNFPPLARTYCNSEFKSDTGWGCMIRVGQMMFAQALKKHIFFDKLKFGDTDLTIPRKDLKRIILGFLDDDYSCPEIAPYSIQKIANVAYEELKHIPGEWYNPSNINYLLEKLHNNHKIKGAENLEFLISNDGMVFLDKILEKLEHKECECDYERKLEAMLNISENSKEKIAKKIIIQSKEDFLEEDSKKGDSVIIRKKMEDEDSESSNELIENNEEEKNNSLSNSYDSLNLEDVSPLKNESEPCKFCKSTKKSLFLIIMVQIGLETPGLNYLEIVKMFMKSPYSIGMVGGKPSSALYFVGLHQDEFLYLDPHYVQNSTNLKNIDILLDTYFCENIKTMKAQNISPSLALGFYFRNALEAKNFYYFLQKISKTNEESFFLGLEKNSSKYDDFKNNINQINEKNLSASWEIIE